MKEQKTSLHDDLRMQVLEQEEKAIRQADSRFNAAHSGEDCKLCNAGPHIEFSMAFQPIVSLDKQAIVAYEALARGPKGEAASTVLDHTLHNNRYSIDQRCREKAIALSSTLGILETSADLCVNFYPNAVYEPKQCLKRTLNIAESVKFPLSRVIFEFTEVEEVHDRDHLLKIMKEYRRHGLRIAIDDFGAGYSGLNLLSDIRPDMLKIDRHLVQHLDQRPASRTIVRSIVQVCREMEIQLIAEGVEREEEMQVLCELGIDRMQGYFFARPAFEELSQCAVFESHGKKSSSSVQHTFSAREN